MRTRFLISRFTAAGAVSTRVTVSGSRLTVLMAIPAVLVTPFAAVVTTTAILAVSARLDGRSPVLTRLPSCRGAGGTRGGSGRAG